VRHGIAWKYYGEGFSEVNSEPPANLLYCSDCNPFQYAKSIMTTALRNNIQDLPQFYSDIQNNTLPGSFVYQAGRTVGFASRNIDSALVRGFS
jgi:hypothetical protein